MSMWNVPFRVLKLLSDLDQLSETERARSGLGSALGLAEQGGFPPLNIWKREQDVVVTAELPGVDPQSLDLSVAQDALTLRGERKIPKPDEAQTWHRREREGGQFARTVKLPFPVDAEQVEASYRDGVLEVRLGRPEQQKPQRIEVTSGG